MRSDTRRPAAVLLPIGLALLTSACGGDGGSVASPGTVAAPVPVTPTPAPTPVAVTKPSDLAVTPRPATRSANDSAEFRINYNSNEEIRLLYAFDNGYTGRGVTIGVLDGGFYTGTSELAGRTSTLSRDFGSIKTPVGNSTTSYTLTARNDVAAVPSDDHGTLVAELLAGNRNGTGSVGVAPDASLAYLRVDDAIPSQPNSDGTVNYAITGTNIAAALNYATAQRIPILNLSLGISGGSNTGTLAGAIDNYARSKGLFVIAAGNSAGADPESIQLLTTTNRASWLAVGGLSADLTAFALDVDSNRAGSLADRYIVAPFVNIVSNINGQSGYLKFSGTSGAVPLVAAAAALVMQKWPQLTGQDAGNVLLATARDLGDPGVDPVFGHGLLDIQAALSPVNPVLAAATGTAVPLGQAVFAPPAGVGTGAVTAHLARLTVLDRFGRDFTIDARTLVRSAASVGTVRGLVVAYQGLRSNVAHAGNLVAVSDVQFADGPVRDGDPVARLAGGAVAVTVGRAQFELTQGRTPWSGTSAAGLGPQAAALTAYAPATQTGLRTALALGAATLTFDAGTGGAAAYRGYAGMRTQAAALHWAHGPWTLGGGVVAEDGSLFGSRSAGTLRLGSGADTVFGDARFDRAVGGWRLSGYGSVGVTHVRALDASLLTAPSALTTTRFGVEAEHGLAGLLLTMGLAQPLNVEHGSATLRWSNGYDLASRSLTYASDRVSLNGDRQLLGSLGVTRGAFRLGLVEGVLRRETGAVASWGTQF